jgi:hypothetical protein
MRKKYALKAEDGTFLFYLRVTHDETTVVYNGFASDKMKFTAIKSAEALRDFLDSFDIVDKNKNPHTVTEVPGP